MKESRGCKTRGVLAVTLTDGNLCRARTCADVDTADYGPEDNEKWTLFKPSTSFAYTLQESDGGAIGGESFNHRTIEVIIYYHYPSVCSEGAGARLTGRPRLAQRKIARFQFSTSSNMEGSFYMQNPGVLGLAISSTRSEPHLRVISDPNSSILSKSTFGDERPRYHPKLPLNSLHHNSQM